MFTGRGFVIETGLYYCRARYYNPYIGHDLLTDPLGLEEEPATGYLVFEPGPCWGRATEYWELFGVWNFVG